MIVLTSCYCPRPHNDSPDFNWFSPQIYDKPLIEDFKKGEKLPVINEEWNSKLVIGKGGWHEAWNFCLIIDKTGKATYSYVKARTKGDITYKDYFQLNFQIKKEDLAEIAKMLRENEIYKLKQSYKYEYADGTLAYLGIENKSGKNFISMSNCFPRAFVNLHEKLKWKIIQPQLDRVEGKEKKGEDLFWKNYFYFKGQKKAE